MYNIGKICFEGTLFMSRFIKKLTVLIVALIIITSPASVIAAPQYEEPVQVNIASKYKDCVYVNQNNTTSETYFFKEKSPNSKTLIQGADVPICAIDRYLFYQNEDKKLCVYDTKLKKSTFMDAIKGYYLGNDNTYFYYVDGSRICSYNVYTKKTTTLADYGTFMYCADGYIYYNDTDKDGNLNIWRSKGDGSSKQRMEYNKQIKEVFFVGDLVFYNHNDYYTNSSSKFFFIDKDGKEHFVCDIAYNIKVSENLIYFQDNNTGSLKMIDANNPDKVVTLVTNILNYSLGDDSIYYTDRYSNILYTSRKDGTNKQILYQDPLLNYFINCKDTIFIRKTAQNSAIIKYDKNNNKKQLLTGEVKSITIYRDYIYYIQNEFLYRIKTDGTGKRLLVNEKITNYSIDNNRIYYLAQSESYLKTIACDGSGKTSKVVSSGYIINSYSGRYITYDIVDGYIYYYEERGLSYILVRQPIIINEEV